MTDATEAESKPEGKGRSDNPENKVVRLIARILYALDHKDDEDKDGEEKEGEAAAESEETPGFAAKRKEYTKKARNLVRRLEKRGAKIVPTQ